MFKTIREVLYFGPQVVLPVILVTTAIATNVKFAVSRMNDRKRSNQVPEFKEEAMIIDLDLVDGIYEIQATKP